jgi:hypothetical protein
MIASYPRTRAAVWIAWTVSVFVLLPSCRRLGERMEITETREVSAYEATPKLSAYSQERFGNDPLTWQTPEGWTQAERSQMRPVNLKFGANGEGECYLSMLPGGAGGTAANVNRWRKQMGQPEISEAEVEALPKRVLMGIQGAFVTLDGAFTNVGATEAIPDQRMVGIVATLGEVGLFVKMVGPKALVEENAGKFDQFVESLKLRAPQGGGN